MHNSNLFCSTQSQSMFTHTTPIVLQAYCATSALLCYKLSSLHILHVYPSLVCPGTLLTQSTWPAPPQRWHEACTVPIILLHSLQVLQYTHFLKFLTKVCVFLNSSSQLECVLTGHLVFLHTYNLSVGFAGCLQMRHILLRVLVFFWFAL